MDSPQVFIRTSGVYLRAEEGDWRTLDEADDEERAALIAAKLERWKSIASG